MNNTEIDSLIDRYSQLSFLKEKISEAGKELINCYENGNKLLICGNGGSASDSEHIVGELMKDFRKKRSLKKEFIENIKKIDSSSSLQNKLCGALPAISLSSQTTIMTALINDCDPDIIYAQQVYGYGKSGDVLLAMSTSGNSKNIYNASITAKALGIKTILITGNKRGKICDIADVCIEIPESETYKIQELTLPIYHSLCLMLEEYFWD